VDGDDYMAMVKANGIEFYYEIHGEGAPLVLLEGLGYSTWMWYKQVEELAKHFKVIIFDNRGVGKTEKPDMDYTIDLFAEDTAEILSEIDVHKAHILGVSMGGFIGQAFVAKYPEMVDKLVLCSTSFGGPNSIPIPQETLNIMLKGGGQYNSLEEIKEAIGVALDKEYIKENDEILNKIIEEKTREPQPKYAYQRQLMAGASFNGEESASRIKASSTVISL